MSKANLGRAALSAVEPLETRVLLSVTPQPLFDQYLHTGVTWVYDVTTSAGNATQTNTVLGPATAPDGATATEEVQTVLQGTFSTDNGDVTGTEETDDYYGLGANGLVDYYVNHVETDEDTGQSNTFNDTFSPYKTVFPASLSAGATVDETDTDTQVDVDDQDSTPSVSNETHEITLVSETPTSITVPAGTFSCYEVTYTHTSENSDDTDTSTNTETDYFSPGIGVVELSSTADDLTEKLASFKGANDTLAFTAQPTDAGVSQTIAPAVAVALEDSSGNVDTNASGSITIALGTSTGTGTLAGTLTEPVTDGVAMFGDLSINQSGTYALSATSTAASGTATSKTFQIGGDHLVFTTQPVDSAVNAPIPVTVTVEDSSNAVDTSVDGTIDLSLDTISSGDGATLGGVDSATLKNGVATFSGKDAPKVDVSGTYTLTADLSGDDGDITVASGTSDEFHVGTDTIAFEQFPPKFVDPDAPIPFSVKALDSDKKIDTDFDGQIQVSLSVHKGNLGGATLGGTMLADFDNGVATFDESDAPTINQVGRYYLTMSADGADGSPDANIKPLKSVVTVSKLHLSFVLQPDDTDVKAPIIFSVALKDSHDNTVTEETTDEVYIKDVYITDGKQQGSFVHESAPLIDGVATFDADTNFTLGSAGTFRIQVVEADSQDTQILSTANAYSKAFKVLGFHLEFVDQPQTTPAGQIFTFSVEILNSVGDLVTTEDGLYLDILRLIKKPGSGDNTNSGLGTPAELSDGVATFSQETIATPGVYKFTVVELLTVHADQSQDTVAFYTKAAVSLPLTIT